MKMKIITAAALCTLWISTIFSYELASNPPRIHNTTGTDDVLVRMVNSIQMTDAFCEKNANDVEKAFVELEIQYNCFERLEDLYYSVEKLDPMDGPQTHELKVSLTAMTTKRSISSLCKQPMKMKVDLEVDSSLCPGLSKENMGLLVY